ncbi:MAG: hypothetical protein C5B46_09700 [Proteobacteria bacterium]|nr:MAG: hypothetical protein C5B46_09700 [Pseudomonadota bacterium]
MRELITTLLLWINAHGFPSCVGIPEVALVQSEQTHGYVAWYQAGVINLSERFDYDRLFPDGSDNRNKLARSALLHEITHYCQEQRDGARRVTERMWLEREDEAYRLQTVYLREHGSSTVLVWRKDQEG